MDWKDWDRSEGRRASTKIGIIKNSEDLENNVYAIKETDLALETFQLLVVACSPGDNWMEGLNPSVKGMMKTTTKANTSTKTKKKNERVQENENEHDSDNNDNNDHDKENENENNSDNNDNDGHNTENENENVSHDNEENENDDNHNEHKNNLILGGLCNRYQQSVVQESRREYWQYQVVLWVKRPYTMDVVLTVHEVVLHSSLNRALLPSYNLLSTVSCLSWRNKNKLISPFWCFSNLETNFPLSH